MVGTGRDQAGDSCYTQWRHGPRLLYVLAVAARVTEEWASEVVGPAEIMGGVRIDRVFPRPFRPRNDFKRMM